MIVKHIQRFVDSSIGSIFAVKADPKTQMWMGTYPSNPSYVLSTGEPLADHLKRNPQLIGKTALDRWGCDIPFLPKVSVLIKYALAWNIAQLDQDPFILQSPRAPNPSR